MRSIFLLLVGIVAAAAGFAQKADSREPVALKESSFDFGRIPQGRPVTHNFELKNNGSKPLLIQDVQASCGCTTPQWSEKPIPPGGSTTIKVGFNAATEGRFAKNITILLVDQPAKNVVISGDVYAMPTTSAPLNTSLSLIK